MSRLQQIEDAIERIYTDAYLAYKGGRVRDLPRLNPNVGYLSELWYEFDRLVAKEES